jgi:hypothetical protein
MIVTCIDHLTTALAEMSTTTGMEVPSRDILQGRLETLRRATIYLRPGDAHGYRVLALLFHLPDLRPESRTVLLNYLHSNLDFPQPETESCNPARIEAPPSPEPARSTDSPPLSQAQEPAPEPPPSPDADFSFTTTRREDLFDRFLSWIAALVC